MDKDTALDLALGALEVGWSPTYTGLDAKEMGMKAITAIKQARSAPVQPVAWPAGLIDRIKAAEQRIQDGHAPRRIPADPTDVDLVLAEVRYLLEGKQPPFWIKTTPPAQPAPVQKPYRPLQDNGSQYFGGSWDTLPTQSAPVQEPVAWVDLLKQAEEVVRSKSLWKKYIDGTPLANDIAVWMASFAQEHTTLPAQPAPVQPETDLCGSGAGCLYKVAMIEHLESEVEHLKAAQPAPVQEPVAWMTINAYGEEDDIWYENPEGHLIEGWTYKPLYAHPAPVQEPVWIQPDHLQKAQRAPFLCRVEPHKRDDFVPLYTTPPAGEKK